MQSVFSGDIEVSIMRAGREIARVIRPLRETAIGPVIRFKKQLWPVRDGVVYLDAGPIVETDAEVAENGIPSAGEDDNLQDAVISALSSDRLLVDAGPGTGKTFVACSRVAALINAGIPAGRVWLVSFTRTAIQEIRNRLESYVDDPADAAAVKIATLDSHAWAIQAGFSDEARLTGSHNDNIRTTLEHILEDQEVQAYLGRIRHLVVDEAQDIIGDRARLVLALIDHMNDDCGVTVFCDRAQAIYGFTEDSPSVEEGNILVDELQRRSFEPRELRRVHRTSDPSLLKIFTTVRQQVLDERLPPTKKGELVRNEIRRLAANQLGQSWDLDLTEVPTNSLVLVRQRCDALTISGENAKIPHRLRMSGLPARVLPWLAHTFWDYAERRVSHYDFMELWQTRIGGANLPFAPERAWQLMVESAGVTGQLVDLYRLRELLSRSSPPVIFTSPEYGDEGPVVGTIHASKGREGDNVFLYLPPVDDDADDEEEIRVVYVGATRAREQLSVGNAPGQHSRNIDGRVWKRLQKDKLLIEIGRAGDLNAEGLVGVAAFSEQDARKAQSFIALNPSVQGLYAAAKADLGWNMDLVTPDKQRIAVLTGKVKADLREIAKSTNRWPQPSYLAHVRSIGLRTLAIRPDDPDLERLHEPWRSSGFLLAPMLVGFGWSQLKERR
uniref:UvrD-like helicase family protein n=1 Tax=Rhizobium rhizogenes TaxID=359 RepID=A0A7S4ZUZ6_RHIRH|nr:UvrD-helicase domain-containing protein [Rhizobium rhizogenes]QCL10444.1 UvrD-like helicase family protein [Rhizobium rhizogenes]